MNLDTPDTKLPTPEVCKEYRNDCARVCQKFLSLSKQEKHSADDLGFELCVNMPNLDLFKQLKRIAGDLNEHRACVYDFIQRSPAEIDAVMSLSASQFSSLMVGSFLGFKSLLSCEEISNAMHEPNSHEDANLRRAEKAEFCQTYWMYVREACQKNFLNARFVTQLDVEVLKVISASSIAEITKLARLSHQRFTFLTGSRELLPYISAGLQCFHGSHLGIYSTLCPNQPWAKKQKDEFGDAYPEMPMGKLAISHSSNRSQLLKMHRYGQLEPIYQNAVLKLPTHQETVIFKSLVDLANEQIAQSKANSRKFQKQKNLKTAGAELLTKLNISRTQSRVLFAISDGRARGIVDKSSSTVDVLKSFKCESHKVEDYICRVLVSMFATFYWSLSKERIFADICHQELLEAWCQLVKFFGHERWTFLWEYVTNLSIFIDCAALIREGCLTFETCPNCRVAYLAFKDKGVDECPHCRLEELKTPCSKKQSS